MKESNNYIVIKISLIVATLFFGIAFVAWTLVPNSQIIRLHKAYQKAIDTYDYTVVTKDASLFTPYTHVQPMLRYVFLAFMVSTFNTGEREIAPKLIPFTLDKIKESLLTTTPYINSYIYISYTYDTLAINESDPAKKQEYLADAEHYYREALNLFPSYQKLIESYGLNLYNQNKHQEAIDLYKKALAVDPHAPKIQYFLGQFLVYENDKYMPEYMPRALEHLEAALSSNFNQDVNLTRAAYKKMFTYFYKKKDSSHLVVILKRLALLDPSQQDKYLDIVKYITESGKVPEIELNW
ncbi:MAG: Tetratricopeptide repeat [Candidatus Parcubacteria bacterium]|jgi:tetratricopeptide (TPR) repeat protein